MGLRDLVRGRVSLGWGGMVYEFVGCGGLGVGVVEGWGVGLVVGCGLWGVGVKVGLKGKGWGCDGMNCDLKGLRLRGLFGSRL